MTDDTYRDLDHFDIYVKSNWCGRWRWRASTPNVSDVTLILGLRDGLPARHYGVKIRSVEAK
jgi:hypothetical protein